MRAEIVRKLLCELLRSEASAFGLSGDVLNVIGCEDN